MSSNLPAMQVKFHELFSFRRNHRHTLNSIDLSNSNADHSDGDYITGVANNSSSKYETRYLFPKPFCLHNLFIYSSVT